MFGAPLGPFRLSGRIDQGGMGQVWHGVHVRSGLAVAVKLMRADRPQVATAFFDEVRAVARLDHPNVIAVLDCGRVEARASTATRGKLPEGAPWMAMEYCSGGTLGTAPPRDWPALQAVLQDMLAALGCAHARGVLHRDVTPENVLVATADDARPGLKLTDFGLGQAVAEAAPEGSIVGTPAYMAPEQFARATAQEGPWTDLYQLGCVAWTLATGAPPYGSDRPAAVLALAHQDLDLPTFTPRFAVPAGLQEWLGRMLEKAPRRRIQTAADALTALGTLGGNRAPAGGKARPWRGVELPSRPPRLVDAGLGLWSLRVPPLVGRVRERDRLWAELQDVRVSWTARVAMISGPAGVGRSRMVAWIAERAHELGEAHAVLIRAAAASGGAAAGASASARVLAAVLGGSRDPAVLRDHARSLGLPADAVVRAMEPGAPDAGELACAACATLASDRPLVLAIDDCQADPAFVAFADRLLRRQVTSPSPVLLVLAVRPEPHGAGRAAVVALDALMALPVACRIDLAPLTGADEAALLRHGLGLGPAFAERVRERAAGNPSYAVQLVGEAVDAGHVMPLAEGFEVPADAPLQMPEAARLLWIGEVERALGEAGARPDGTSRLALEAAAVLGNRVDEAEWNSVCQRLGIRPPAALVERLVRERLASPARSDLGSTHPAEALSWRFAHPQVRDALVASAVQAGRGQLLQRACAAALSAGRRGQAGVTERIGRHLHEAGDHADAVGWLVRGARRRLSHDDVRAAAGLLALAERSALLANLDPADERQGLVRVLRAIVRIREGDRAAGGRELERVIDLGPEHGWRVTLAEALVARADLHRRAGNADGALSALAQARSLAAELGDDALAARAAMALAAVATELGDLARASELGAQASSLARRANDPRLIADALAVRADAEIGSGRVDLGARLAQEALDLGASVGNRGASGAAWIALGRVEAARGNVDAAVSQMQRGIGALDEVGSPDVVVAAVRLCCLLLTPGRLQESATILAAARKEAARHGLRGWGAAIAALDAARELLAGNEDSTALDAEAFAPLDRGEIADSALAEALDRGARAGLATPRQARAERLARLAAAQWRSLDQHDRADAIEGLLAT